MEDLTWTLCPHGKSKSVAQWVVDNFSHKTDTRAVDTWVKASQQILEKQDETKLDEESDRED